MQRYPYPRITPWVIRLSVINAVTLLLLMTVFTSPAVQQMLAFNPRHAFDRPWTFLTYLTVHDGLLHLLANTLGLVVFGSAVEARLGPRNFLLYYLYCGIGGALFTLGINGLVPQPPVVGASGAVFGLLVAFALFWPDAEVVPFPLPLPIKARTLAFVLVSLNVVLAFVPMATSVAYAAHAGGALFGYLFFRLQSLSRRAPAEPPQAVQRVVMVQSGNGDPPRRATPSTPIRARRRIDADPVAAEMDRVLDKISAEGMSSLTADERRFLFEVSNRKKKDDLH
jgi:membrane associated rhomboid family serine protease